MITVQMKMGCSRRFVSHQTQASNDDVYAVFINADNKAREFVLSDDYKALLNAKFLLTPIPRVSYYLESKGGVAGK